MTAVTDDLTRLALAARSGDQKAAEAFVRATQAEVWRLLAALTDVDRADDLTQETYLRAFRSLPRFRAESSVRTWLLGVARNTAADHVRTRARRPRTELLHAWDETPAPLVTDALAGVALRVAVQSALAQMVPERREAFVLTQMLGLPYAEAAEVVGCPIGTIRSRVARARDDLMMAIGDGEAGPSWGASSR
ncbi:MAG: sigma-70 family RNA polymerase sigma factor [Actinomycetes bacterium]